MTASPADAERVTVILESTLKGEPVIGPLVGRGIKLEPLYVVTTTWGQWKSLHPETDVLSLETGHKRDYGEGVAYRDYFATDKLMFTVPKVDTRLANKDEVLALRDGAAKLAISTKFLQQRPVYHGSVGQQRFVDRHDHVGGKSIALMGECEMEFAFHLHRQTVSQVAFNHGIGFCNFYSTLVQHSLKRSLEGIPIQTLRTSSLIEDCISIRF